MRKSIRILLEKVLDLAGYQIILHKKLNYEIYGKDPNLKEII